MRRCALIALLLALGPAVTAIRAHEVRPGYLELRQRDAGGYAVLWKVPMKGQLRLRLDPVFPATCRAATPIAREAVPGAVVERWTLDCAGGDEGGVAGGGLVGGTVSIAGLDGTLTDVLARVELLGTPVQTVRLDPAAASFTVAAAPRRLDIARAYLVLGVEHILGGVDHLLFVLALLMIVRGRRRLIAAVTAFTAAHSITLALATLGLVRLPSAPVEAAIALSILFLAAEIVRTERGRAGLAARHPWIVAFAFGLLHGFGFAGALAEVGLPERAIPLALFLFNVGVELGQLLFVAAVLVAAALARRLGARLAIPRPAWAWQLPTYAIGTAAAFWTIERVASFWSA